jgi:hypothetical protein
VFYWELFVHQLVHVGLLYDNVGILLD